ncbi:extracellular solute-binding protein [Paenibacillus sp. GSMTC-2017]|uniref:extracellular solute-binding protein n=1 Tax=Paenibacillus sp. GSMTC-2017 TaxID=2794350 RepID=UPI0018D773DD|nr:extracellular solute-binding protein [Paenibacillus sp. GSMTC-2017]MBH5320118.1 extracellular solute-binding protein [Paenibacillus sp. GSMTC-2017]
MKRIISAIILMSLLVTVLSSCGSEKSGVTVTESMDKIEISLWHNFTGDDLRAQTMRAIIDEFQAANQHIRLDIQAIQPDGYRSRLKTVAAADEMPDVFVMWSGAMTQEFSSASLIQPINELIEANPEWRDGFLPNSLESFTEKGHTYGAPMGLSPTSILYYNKKIMDKYNIAVPKTWDELMLAIETLRNNGITPIALGNKAAWLAQSSIFSSLADRVTGTEWFLKAAKQDGASFTDPQFIEALTYMKELAEAGAFQKDYNAIDNNQMELMFAQGKSAMMIDGGWALTNLAANTSKEVMREMGATVLPAIPGGKGDPNTLSGVVGSGMALGKDATGEKKEAALKLIYAMSGPDAQKRTLESNQLVSYKIELDKSKVSPIFAEVYDLVNSVRLTPVYDGVLSSESAEAVNNGLQELLAGGDPKKIAQTIQEAHKKAIAQGSYYNDNPK